MTSSFYHLQLNIDFTNKQFYKNLMEFLGWSTIFEDAETIGYKSKSTGDVWFVAADSNQVQDYDARGLNHLAIRVDTQGDVDALVAFLEEKGVSTLFGTPQHRSDFVDSESDTYYQVMFSSPDNILFEVVYIGAKGI